MSACSFHGRFLGRPRPWRMPGTPSRILSKGTESCWFAGPTSTANGMPFTSVIRWCLVPFFPRSVGFGPIASPPFSPGCSRHPRRLSPSRSSSHRSRLRAGSDAVGPISQAPAIRSTCASRSSHCRSPFPWEGPPNGYLSSGRTGSLEVRSGLERADALHPASPLAAAEAGRFDPKAQRARSLGPSKYTMHPSGLVQAVLLPPLNTCRVRLGGR